MPEPFWREMNGRPRRSMKTLRAEEVPTTPGVYALYRDGEQMYVGKASSLRDRVWKNHSGRGMVMTSSAMRRNVAEHLGLATAADIKAGRSKPTSEQVAAVREWLDGCEVAWRECETEPVAVKLEATMKAEYRPPLTKR